jgi:hypothetical protein
MDLFKLKQAIPSLGSEKKYAHGEDQVVKL